MIREKDYIRGKYCFKNLWNSLNKKDYDLLEEERFKEINYIKNRAFESFDNRTILEEALNREERAYFTKNLLEEELLVVNGTIKWKDLNCKVDGIKSTDRGIIVYFVDTSTRTSKRSFLKGEFAEYILRKSNLKILDIVVMHINNKYVMEDFLDVEKLFKTVSIKDDIEVIRDNFILDIREVIENPHKKINIELGTKCLTARGCESTLECFEEVQDIDIFKIDGNSLNLNKKIEYFNEGIRSFKDVKESLNPKGNFEIMLDCELTNKAFIRKDKIRKFLKEIEKYPLYFLDFETFQESIPSYKGRRPYMQIPFQYSLHILKRPNGTLMHKEFLGNEMKDTTIDFVKSLLKDIEEDRGHIVAYNMAFEKGIIKSMAELHEEYRDGLEKLLDRFVDIMNPFQNKDYYTRDMHFSYSIKSVLPALCGEAVSYKDLNIRNGEMAMLAFPSLKNKNLKERREIRKDLLEYCKLDTLAMVKILEKLKEI